MTLELQLTEANNGERQRGLAPVSLLDLVGEFSTIVADPPWKYGQWGTPSNTANCKNAERWANLATNRKAKAYAMPYPTMSVDEIAALPVAKLAAANCELYLWVTQKYLPDAFRVMAAWGFKYCQTLTWCKTPRGTGQGGIFCPTTEFLLLGRKGKMPVKKRVDTTWWNVKRPHNSHSTKPEHFQDVIETVTNEPRLELFARRKRPNWTTWGNEV
jgi:N6-adenosine-specific RNA methylase IME4